MKYKEVLSNFVKLILNIKDKKMRCKMLTHTQGYIFWDDVSSEAYDLMKSHQKTHHYLEFELFLQIPNLEKTDILELFEYMIMLLSRRNDGEIDELVLDSLVLDLSYYLGDLKSDYSDSYVAIMGQLFLGGYIDFERCGWLEGEECIPAILSQYRPNNQYETWVYFRDNFIYDSIYNINPTQGEFWKNPDNWNYLNIDCIPTQKGNEYFEKVLAPRFYNKYKDLEVEIDSKGNVIRWIGQINRAKQNKKVERK